MEVGVNLSNKGNCEGEIKKRIVIAKDTLSGLNKIWKNDEDFMSRKKNQKVNPKRTGYKTNELSTIQHKFSKSLDTISADMALKN